MASKSKEVPLIVQIWYHCVAVSFLPSDERSTDTKSMEKLLETVGFYMNSHLQHMPDWTRHVENNLTIAADFSSLSSADAERKQEELRATGQWLAIHFKFLC